MERETGIEPATNSLEGCDSTTELLPPARSLTSLASDELAGSRCRRAGPPDNALAHFFVLYVSFPEDIREPEVPKTLAAN